MKRLRPDRAAHPATERELTEAAQVVNGYFTTKQVVAAE